MPLYFLIIKHYNAFMRCSFCVITINVLHCFIDKTLQVIVIVNVQQSSIFSLALHLIFFPANSYTYVLVAYDGAHLMAFLDVYRGNHMQIHFFPIQRRGYACKIIRIETLREGFVPTFLRTYMCAISYRDDRSRMMFAKNKSTFGT